MEIVKCDLCGSGDYEIAVKQTDLFHGVTNEIFSLVKCRHCGLHYLNPRPESDEIAGFYSQKYGFHFKQSMIKTIIISGLRLLADNAYYHPPNHFFQNLASVCVAFLLHLPILKKKFIQLLLPIIPSHLDKVRPGRILDIGCGAGFNAHLLGHRWSLLGLKERGWDVFGVEPCPAARQIIKKQGVTNIFPDIFSAGFRPDFFDVITLNWSLEHVWSPTKYLEECRRIIKPEGKIIIRLPNYSGITSKLFPECVEVPVHLFYFDTMTFKQYCQKTRLHVLEYYTFSYFPLFLNASKIMNNDLNRFYEKFPNRAVNLQEFLNLMARFDLGDDMVFYLTKKHENNID